MIYTKISLIHSPGQVYSQMIKSGVQYDWLSSYTKNILFHMKEDGQGLYMSKPYGSAETTPLVIFSWVCRPAGLLKSPISIPSPDWTYFKQVEAILPKTPYRHGALMP